MTTTFKIPTVEEERACYCDTERKTEPKEESMTESLDHTKGYLLNSLAMLDKLNSYIFAVVPSESSEDVPLGCLRDAVYQNEYLASLVDDKLRRLFDRIVV